MMNELPLGERLEDERCEQAETSSFRVGSGSHEYHLLRQPGEDFPSTLSL